MFLVLSFFISSPSLAYGYFHEVAICSSRTLNWWLLFAVQVRQSSAAPASNRKIYSRNTLDIIYDLFVSLHSSVLLFV